MRAATLILIAFSLAAGSALAATLSLFSEKAIVTQNRGWNGLKDISATVTVESQSDALTIKAVVNDDQIQQSRDPFALEKGDHVSVWLDFGDGEPVRILLAPGKHGSSRPAATVSVGKREPAPLRSASPTVTWGERGYEIDVSIALADLDLEPGARLLRWGAFVGDTDVPAGRPADVLRDQENSMRYFINRCHDAGLTIDAMVRGPADELESRTTQVIRFEQKMTPRQRFDGLAFDLSAIFPDTASFRAAVVRQAQAKLAKSAELWRRQFPRQPITLLLPRWLLGSKHGPAAADLARECDQVIVLAAASKERELGEAAREGLELASSENKPFWIGVPAEARSQEPENALRKVSGTLSGAPSFRGFVFIDYAGYRLMREAPQPPVGDETPRAVCVRSGSSGLGDLLLSNDYFQKEFFKFCSLPFLDRERKITRVFFTVGAYTRGMDSVEIRLRAPAKFDPSQRETWAEYK